MLRARTGAAVVLTTGTLVLTACGGGEPGGTEAAEGESFTWWSEFTEGQPEQQLFQQIIDDFEAETGIEVDVQWKGPQPVKQLLPQLNSAGGSPVDLVDTYHTEVVTQLGSADQAMDLSSVFDEPIPGEDGTLREAIGDAYAEASAPTGTQTPLLAPFMVSGYGFLYDGQALPEVAANPPETWEDFLAVLDELKAQGRQPLAAEGSLTGNNAYYLNSLLQAQLGYEGWLEALRDPAGETWESEPVLAAARSVQHLVDGGYFLDGYEATQFPGMRQKWANHEADFILDGSYAIAESEAFAAPGFDFQSFPFPTVDGKAPPMMITLNGFGVIKGGDGAEAAATFVAFALKKEYQEGIAKTGKIPARQDVAAPESLAGLKASLDAGNAIQTQFEPNDIEFLNTVLYPNNDKLFFGDMSAEEFASAMKSDAARFWKSKS